MDNLKQTWRKTPRPARKVIVFIIGVLLIVGGSLMLVLPGPGWATIFLGLAVLATEFDRAERIRHSLVVRFKQLIHKAHSKNKH